MQAIQVKYPQVIILYQVLASKIFRLRQKTYAKQKKCRAYAKILRNAEQNRRSAAEHMLIKTTAKDISKICKGTKQKTLKKCRAIS